MDTAIRYCYFALRFLLQPITATIVLCFPTAHVSCWAELPATQFVIGVFPQPAPYPRDGAVERLKRRVLEIEGSRVATLGGREVIVRLLDARLIANGDTDTYIPVGADVLFASTSAIAVEVASVTTVPLVFDGYAQDIEASHAHLHARQRALVHGFNRAQHMERQQIDLLFKLFGPQAKHVGVLWGGNEAGAAGVGRPYLRDVLRARGVRASFCELPLGSKVDGCVAAFRRERVNAIYVAIHRNYDATPDAYSAFEDDLRVPMVFEWPRYVTRHGLFGYNTTNIESAAALRRMFTALASGVRLDQPLLQFSSQTELVINLRTARKLGIKIPRGLLALATTYVE